ncbi:MAG: hypothetical protein LAT55_05775 [Opitutales bacterium]|nr:hypothetical protein [Opitutales bacterium]
MTTLTSIILAIILLVAIFAIIGLLSRQRGKENHEKVHTRYIYRDEPHADQTTESPNRLQDNDITKG